MPFIVMLLLAIAGIAASVFVPYVTLVATIGVYIYLFATRKPARDLMELFFPDQLPAIILNSFVFVATVVSLAVHLFA